MICDQFQENLELYALGVLESAEASAVAEHLSTGCAACRDALQRALDQNLAIAKNVPIMDPPRRLRKRVQEAVSPTGGNRRQWIPWSLLAAAAVIVLAVVSNFQLRLSQQNEVAESMLNDRTRLLGTLNIIRAPGTREVSFTDAKTPTIHGALYIHQQLGVAMVIDRLPKAPGGWKYESWLVPKTGAPRPVEAFQPDKNGRAISVVPGPLALAEVGAVAVSMEPENSRPTKPTTLVFAANI